MNKRNYPISLHEQQPLVGKCASMKQATVLARQTASSANKAARLAWYVCWLLLYRPSPRPWHAWRRLILRCFGARIEPETYPYPGARIWAPWNLEMLRGSCIADDVDCYCVGKIKIGERATISQGTFLCTASHDYLDSRMPLVVSDILIGNDAWVTARAYIGPGVQVGTGAIIAACAVVVKNVPDWTIVGGNPAIHIKDRPPICG